MKVFKTNNKIITTYREKIGFRLPAELIANWTKKLVVILLLE